MPQTIMYLLSPINDWSSTRPDGSCTCHICSLLGNKTPKTAQPNVVGMRTPNGPVSLWRADPLFCYSLSDSVEHDVLTIGNLVCILHSKSQSPNPTE